MRLKSLSKIAAVLACTLALTSFTGVFEQNEVYAAADHLIDEQGSAHTAGVTALLSSIEETTGLTAGVTEAFVDCSLDNVYVSDNEAVVVTASQESENAAPQDGAINPADWGYTNLGIANVKECLNVRDQASTAGEVVGKMTSKNACEIISIKDGWAKIKSGKVNGYVKAEYLLTGDEAVEIAKNEIVTYVSVTTSTLRVRKKASTDAKVVTLVAKGEELDVVNQDKEGWIKVQLDNEKGYVSSDYVQVGEKLPTAQKVTMVKESDTVSSTKAGIVSTALQYVGNPYKWGGTSLTNGVDCSGFTMKIYAQYGVYLPHSSRAQPSYGKKVSASEAQPGDLFFYGNGGSINHVAMYIGNGQVVHASNKKDGIKVSNAFYRKPICVSRYLK